MIFLFTMEVTYCVVSQHLKAILCREPAHFNLVPIQREQGWKRQRKSRRRVFSQWYSMREMFIIERWFEQHIADVSGGGEHRVDREDDLSSSRAFFLVFLTCIQPGCKDGPSGFLLGSSEALKCFSCRRNVCSGFAGFRKQRIELIMFCWIRRSVMHFNEHFLFFRGGVLPGIRRLGFTEHFYVSLWVSPEKHTHVCRF